MNWFWHHIWIQEREPNIPPGNIQKTLNTIYVHKVSDKWKQYWPYQRVLEFACYKKELNLFRSPKSRVFIVFTFMHHFSTSLLVQIHYRVWLYGSRIIVWWFQRRKTDTLYSIGSYMYCCAILELIVVIWFTFYLYALISIRPYSTNLKK